MVLYLINHGAPAMYTYRAIILCHPGQDTANIDITFYADNDAAARLHIELFLRQCGLQGDAMIAQIG